MAKQLEYVKILIEGTDTAPSSARFIYKVYEVSDPTLNKVVHLVVDGPNFATSITDFFNNYVAIIKTNEGIV